MHDKPMQGRTVEVMTTAMDATQEPGFSGIRNKKAFETSLRDFSWLHSVVPGASDLDMCCERNGSVLMLEGKTWFGGGGLMVAWGQWKMLLTLSDQPGITMVLVGQGTGPDDLYLLTLDRTVKPKFSRNHAGQAAAYLEPALFTSVTQEQMRARVKAWWDKNEPPAKKKKAPTTPSPALPGLIPTQRRKPE